MNLPPVSREQQDVLTNLENNNIIVDSVAGSGKTTCNLYIAKHYTKSNILLLTYNARLKLETREKVESLNLTNLEVHSYHSFCVKYYNTKCYNDSVINTIIEENTQPKKPVEYDIIILDEAQDITPLYYKLICKIYKNNSRNARFCILGDKYQSIYAFNNADQRFIMFASNVFNFNKLDWKYCKLSTSFRMTNQISKFINNCFLHSNRIITQKEGNIPRYIICNTFGIRTFQEVLYYLSLGYEPSDIFILAPSVKSEKNPARQLENKIKTKLPNIKIFVPTSDKQKLNKDILEGKLVISTFHQVKGLERKVVIVFNIDMSYFEYFNTTANKYSCPNEIYVAITRSLEHLTVFHHQTNSTLPFIKELENNCYVEISKPIKELPCDEKKKTEYSVTDLIKYLPQCVIDDCCSHITLTTINSCDTLIDLPLVVQNELVCDINGIALPLYYEYSLKKDIKIFNELITKEFENQQKIKKISKPYSLSNIILDKVTPSELLYIANCWLSLNNGYIFKLQQLQDYSWLSSDALLKSQKRLEKLNISINSSFECYLSNNNIKGFADCIDFDCNTIYEFKCVQHLEKEHYLQSIIYKYLFDSSKNINSKCFLFNILTNELVQLECKYPKMKEIIEYLMYCKNNTFKTNDNEFLNEIISIKNNYFS